MTYTHEGRSGARVRKGHPLPLICVGDAYIPLGQDGCQATDSHSCGVRKLVVPEPPEPTTVHPSFLTVPLSFGLETVACFPKSYRWMSEEARSRSLDSGTASSSPTASVPTSSSPLSDVTVGI